MSSRSSRSTSTRIRSTASGRLASVVPASDSVGCGSRLRSMRPRIRHGLAGDGFCLGGQLVAIVVPHDQPWHGHEGACNQRNQEDGDDDQATQGRLDPSNPVRADLCRATVPTGRRNAGIARGSSPRMRLVVQLHQMLTLDRRVALRGRQAGMAEQLLDHAQIGAAGQKMGREAVPQRMGRGILRQADARRRRCCIRRRTRVAGRACRAPRRTAARRRRGDTGTPRGSRRTPRRSREGSVPDAACRPCRLRSASAGRRAPRHRPRSRASASPIRRPAPYRTEKGPGRVPLTQAWHLIVGRFVEQCRGVRFRQGPRQALLQTRRPQRRRGRVVASVLAVEKPVEAAHRSEHTRGRALRQAAPVPRSQPGAEIGGGEREQIVERRRPAQVLRAEADEPLEVGPIRLDGGRAPTFLMRQPVQPCIRLVRDLRVRKGRRRRHLWYLAPLL